MQGLVAVGVSLNCPDGVVPASQTQGKGCARRPLLLDSVRRTGVLQRQSCRAGRRLYTGTQRRGRLRQPSVRNVAVRALVQEGWPLWAALSACAAGGQVRLQWNMVEYHEICELRWLSWRQNVSVDVCLVLMHPLTLLHDCWLIGTGAKNLIWFCSICTSALIATGTCLVSWRRPTSHLPGI